MGERAGKMPGWRGWGPLIVFPVLVLTLFPSEWPRWAFMWTLAFAIYCGFKWLSWRRVPLPAGIPASRHAAYLLAWPGMDAPTFLTSDKAVPPTVREWLLAMGKTLLGVIFFWVLPRFVDKDFSAGLLGMVGIAFMLHFGLFHLLSCFWRSLGRDARPLMDNPAAAESVGEFWGRRWNRAFRDLSHRFLYSPLARKSGRIGALLAVFVFSGLLHDLVISVPAGGGWGLPTIFFLIQAGAIMLERSATGKRLGLGRGCRGWLFAWLILAGPSLLLFHFPFVYNVIVPFMRDLGAWT